MSRHRNLKQFIEDEDEYDDFDPMDDDEASEDFYIAEVIGRYKKLPREKILKALDDCDWDIGETVKLLKQREGQGKGPGPGKVGVKGKGLETKAVESPLPVVGKGLSKVEVEMKREKSAEEVKSQPEESRNYEVLNKDYPDIYPAYTPRPGKSKINLVVIGHVDAGKSTLMGHLLHLLGYIDKKTIAKYEKDSKSIGKDSFHFAWVLDASEEERTRGVTIDVGCSYFSTPSKSVTLLDAPGHKDFIPNMISGAAQADAAILVIDSGIGEFESGFEGVGNFHGQTKEHSHLARALGITYLIVAVNKLDVINWDQARFIQIKSLLEPFLKKSGFKDVFFIPISGLNGDNLTTKSGSSLLNWYTGASLVDLIDQIPLPGRTYTKPLRMCIMDSYKLSHGNIIGQVFSGKIEGGQLKINDKILIAPCGVSAVVKHIEIEGSLADHAVAGESVSVSVKDTAGDFLLVNPGDVVSAFGYSVPLVKKFRAKVFTFDILFPITKGLRLVMFVQSLKVVVWVNKLHEHLDSVTGKVLKANPRCLTSNMTGVVEIETEFKICLERFACYKSLGRVLFRDRSETVMAGMVLELLE